VGETPDPRDLREEEARLLWLRNTVDDLCRALKTEPLSYEEAAIRVGGVRRAILARFPTKGELYEWVYAPRFARILNARFGRSEGERVICL
jgi:hypothetical protein